MKRMLLLICSTLSFLPLLGMNQKQIIPITTASYPQADNQQFAAQQMPYLTTMDNATAQQQPNKTICKACCDCADSCCNSAHNCCNCCVDTYLKSIFAMIICVADIAFLPVACLCRPLKRPDDPSRNDGFCYFTRTACEDCLKKKTCCDLDITTSASSGSEALFGS